MEVNAQQNFFVVSIKMPPPGTLNVSDFWNITVTNNSGSDLSGYLVGTAKEDKDGMIAKGTTVPIMLKKGLNSIKIKDLPKTPDVEYIASDPRYKESLIRQGKFPSGKYEICVKVISATTNEELGSDCINQEVLETGLLTLINPANGEDIDSKVPITFTWSSGGKIPEGGYTLKICEVMENQTPETAMKSNKAWFEKKGIHSTTFAYPNSAKGFSKGKIYAWMVKNGNTISEASMFSIINSEIRDTLSWRNSVNFWSIDAELTKICKWSISINRASCFEYDQTETITHGGDITNPNGWLWSGSDGTYIFSIEEQNALVADAKLWAIDNGPNCNNGRKKLIISIEFYTTITTDINSAYYIGCHVNYGCCTQLMGPDVN